MKLGLIYKNHTLSNNHIRSAHSSILSSPRGKTITWTSSCILRSPLATEPSMSSWLPVQMLIEALNEPPRFTEVPDPLRLRELLPILSGLDRRFTDLEVRRAFTVFQMMTVLEDNRHTLMILEHDPLLYEDAEEMVEYVSRAMREAAKSCTVLLYSPASDPFLEKMMNYADRVFCFAEGPRTAARPSAKSSRKAQTSSTGQTTLEVF